MSSLGPLFIPRKDNFTVPKTSDNPEMERYLQDLQTRIHTNELAIQRWANSVPRLAAVIGAGSSVNVLSNATAVDVPLDGTQNTYFRSMISGNTLVIPQAGWYTISAAFVWDPGSLPAPDFSGTVEVFLVVNGVFPGVSSTGAAAFNFISGPPSIVNIVDDQVLSFTGLFALKDIVELQAFHNVTTTPGPAPDINIPCSLISCGLTFLGPSPTTVQ